MYIYIYIYACVYIYIYIYNCVYNTAKLRAAQRLLSPMPRRVGSQKGRHPKSKSPLSG